LDPYAIPGLWRQGILYDSSNDEPVMSPFPNLSDDIFQKSHRRLAFMFEDMQSLIEIPGTLGVVFSQIS